jgi:two-component system nitrogen regulation response regulator NtrX
MLVGRSTAMAHLRELIGRAASSQRTVLVAGEAGVGKDLVARLVHDLSERASRPFIRASCAHNDASALEEDLFGLVPSSRSPGRAGLLETVRGGTLVLDECTTLPAALRTRIARAIVDRSATRVGGNIPVLLDVRVVLTASDPDASPGHRVQGDLFFGDVSVLPIVIPPLRERRSDILLLVSHFRARIAREQGIAARALAANVMMSLLARQSSDAVSQAEAVPGGAGGPAGGWLTALAPAR